MATPRTWSLLCCLASGLAGCAAADGDYIPGADAGVDPRCDTELALILPAVPVAPAIIQVTAAIERAGSLAGIEVFTWHVLTSAGQELEAVPQDPDARAISFAADQPGPYRISVTAAVGGTPCAGASEVVNVSVDGAERGVFRLHVFPAPGQPAPPQEHILEIPGGADYDLGTLTLGSGLLASGSVRTTDGAPLAAYLRITPASAPDALPLEVFSASDGVFQVRLENRDHDVLVVPADNAVAPRLFRGVRPTDVALRVEPGLPVDGVVVDPAGAALAGARVAMRVDSVPSTLAITDASGAFALWARSGDAATLAIVPPQPGALPQLSLDADHALAPGNEPGALTIAYADELSTRAVSLQVTEPDGVTPVPAARLTWLGRSMPGAGALHVDGAAPRPLAGLVRASQVADEDGVIEPVTLVETLYDLVIEPPLASPAGAITVIPVDLRPGASTPARVSVAPAAQVLGRAVDGQGEGVAGARITAAPTGLLALATTASLTVTAAADGSFFLPLTGGAAYELSLASPDARHGRERVDVRAPAAGQVLDMDLIPLGRALRVAGRVAIAGTTGGGSGAVLRLLCFDCADGDASFTLAEAVADSAGRFVLAVPDPQP